MIIDAKNRRVMMGISDLKDIHEQFEEAERLLLSHDLDKTDMTKGLLSCLNMIRSDLSLPIGKTRLPESKGE